MAAEQSLSKNTIAKLNAMLACNPTRCLGVQCPVYMEEERLCDAKRTIELISTILDVKFEGVKTYEG